VSELKNIRELETRLWADADDSNPIQMQGMNWSQSFSADGTKVLGEKWPYIEVHLSDIISQCVGF